MSWRFRTVCVFVSLAAEIAACVVRVSIGETMGVTTREFASVDLDWWSDDGSEGGNWSLASVLTVDFESRRLLAACRALSPGLLRVGGSRDVEARYAMDPFDEAWCKELHAFRGRNVSLCLGKERIEQVLRFAQSAGLRLVWGLGYPGGYSRESRGVGDSVEVPAWNSSNAFSLLRYFRARADGGAVLFAVELGEEMTPEPASQSFAHLVAAYEALRAELDSLWPCSSEHAPLLVGPCVGMASETNGDAACDPSCETSAFFKSFLNESLVDAVCMHSYNNDGPWPAPGFVSQTERQYCSLRAAVDAAYAARDEPPPPLWCGECGPHNGGGLVGVTDRFASSFWYLDALGALARNGAPIFGRQSLAGGNYALLDATRDYAPNPDFFVAQLWTRLMGRASLDVTLGGADSDSVDSLRVYAHCGVESGLALAFVNVSPDSHFQLVLQGATLLREEWLLSAPSPLSREIKLNGATLEIPKDDVPQLPPRTIHGTDPLQVPPLTLGFAFFPEMRLEACALRLPDPDT